MADTRTQAQRRSIMQAVRSKNTAAEVSVRSTLHRLGFRFRLHYKNLPGTPDIVFPSRKSVIFVHGCFWHGHECPGGKPPSSNVDFWREKLRRNRERDSRSRSRLRNVGWRVLTVWECEIKEIEVLVDKMCRFLRTDGDDGRAHEESLSA